MTNENTSSVGGDSEILQLLLNLTILAHKDKLNRDGEFHYSKWINYEDEQELIELDERSMLKYSRIEVSQTGGTFYLNLQAIGKLEEYLKFAGFPITFTVCLINERFQDYFLIDDDITFVKCFQMSPFEKSFNSSKLDADKVNETLENIKKLILFPYIKNSS